MVEVRRRRCRVLVCVSMPKKHGVYKCAPHIYILDLLQDHRHKYKGFGLSGGKACMIKVIQINQILFGLDFRWIKFKSMTDNSSHILITQLNDYFISTSKLIDYLHFTHPSI